MKMSEGSYRKAEEVDENATNLGVPEKQPYDLGIHKVMFGPGQPGDLADPPKNKHNMAESITIVQDEYSSWEKVDAQKNRCVRKRAITASFICVLFIGLEFAGGFLSNSLVIAADAAQMLTVLSTLMVSLFALKLSAQRPGQTLTPGWYRVEVMGTLFSILLTWVLTSVVIYLAFDRLVRRDFVIDVDMMLATSAFGVVANLVMGMSLHNYCTIQYPVNCNNEAPPSGVVNINVRAAFVHIVCDFLFSLAVFITALFIDCCPEWHIIDPVSTMVFSVCVLLITLAILKDLLNVLIEGMPKGIYFSDVLRTLLTIEGVQQVQDLRLWAVSLDKIALSAHITISSGMDYNEVLKIASRRVHSKYNFYEMTIHMEANQELTIDPPTPPLVMPPLQQEK